MGWLDPDAPRGFATANTEDGQVAAIEADLERARDRVAASVRALGQEVARRSDWREWLREYPLAVLTGAAVLGFVMGRTVGFPISNRKRRT
jgi:hypothetical protein